MASLPLCEDCNWLVPHPDEVTDHGIGACHALPPHGVPAHCPTIDKRYPDITEGNIGCSLFKKKKKVK